MTCRRESGSVLVIVLWASLGLVAVTLTFGQSMLMSYRGADNDLAGRQAQQAIEGGIRYAQMLLSEVETPGDLPDPAEYPSEQVQVGEATFWFIGRSDENEAITTPVFGLVDEASKLNINGDSDRSVVTAAMLEALPRMTAELAAAIVDWRDANEDVTDNGAESETYMLRRPSYAAKNGQFESIEELALLNGADRFTLYGEDENLNGVLDANEDDGEASLPADNRDGRLDTGILHYVTVFAREPNTKSDGSARVNVSRMSNNGVADLLREKLGDSRGAAVQQAIGNAEVLSVPEFYKLGALTEDEQAKIDGDITTVSGSFVRGRVNVNTASEAVLACIPGIGADKAASIVAARLNRAEKGSSIDWFLKSLNADEVRAAGPYITGKSYQVSVDVAAVGRNGRGYRRTWAVIDTSLGSPRVIYRRDLSHAGWALGRETRQLMALRKENR